MKNYNQHISESQSSIRNKYISGEKQLTETTYVLLNQKLDNDGNPVVNQYFRPPNLATGTDLQEIITKYMQYKKYYEEDGNLQYDNLKIIKIETIKSYVPQEDIDSYVDSRKYNL